jgi:hypothetical protein
MAKHFPPALTALPRTLSRRTRVSEPLSRGRGVGVRAVVQDPFAMLFHADGSIALRTPSALR